MTDQIESTSPLTSNWHMPVLILLFMAMVAGISVVAYRKNSNATLSAIQTETDTQQVNSSKPLPPPESYIMPSQPAEAPADLELFFTKLSECIPVEMKFLHPYTKTELEKEILGIMDGKCLYVEELPDSGRMECRLTEPVRTAMVAYYRDVLESGSSGTSYNVTLEGTKIMYTINDVAVENPVQTALDSGECVVTGY